MPPTAWITQPPRIPIAYGWYKNAFLPPGDRYPPKPAKREARANTRFQKRRGATYQTVLRIRRHIRRVRPGD